MVPANPGPVEVTIGIPVTGMIGGGWVVVVGTEAEEEAAGTPPETEVVGMKSTTETEAAVVFGGGEAKEVTQELCRSRGGSLPCWMSLIPCCKRFMWPT